MYTHIPQSHFHSEETINEAMRLLYERAHYARKEYLVLTENGAVTLTVRPERGSVVIFAEGTCPYEGVRKKEDLGILRRLVSRRVREAASRTGTQPARS